MSVCGIIAEYNPFHNGHAHQMRMAREQSGCDLIAVVMSGHFVQRGEPAILDKWSRARMALMSGADLVVELPCLHAVRPAEIFARSGIHLLSAMGCECFSFGSELSEASLLQLADISRNEPEPFRSIMRQALDRGESHARARGRALSELSGLSEAAVNQPNASLALEYLKANQALEQPMRPLVIPRVGGGYHDPTLSELSSASAIRAALERGERDPALQAMPAPCAEILSRAYPHQTANPKALDNLLLYALRGMSAESLRGLADMNEGLEYRILRAAQTAASREGLLEAVKCKRYAHARLSRLLLAAPLGLTRELARAHPLPDYIRVLGFRDTALPLLRRIRRSSPLPLVTDPAAFKQKRHPVFELEARSTDLWGLLTDDPKARQAGRDYTFPLVRMESHTIQNRRNFP